MGEPASEKRPSFLRRVRARLVVTGMAVAMSLAWILVAREPATAERLCAGGLTSDAAIALARLTAPLPWSAMEASIATLLLWALARAALGVREIRRGEARPLPSLGAGALWALAVVSVALALFLPLFGVAYARPPLAVRLGWSEAVRAPSGDALELATLAEELIALTNDAYEEVAGSEDLGRPSAPASPRALDLALERSYGRVAERFGLDDTVGAPRGPAKPLLTSRAFTLLGITGIYFPFTGEASYNADEPWCMLAHTIAHEKAHQRLFASEDEANYAGFLACALSDDAYARYSGLLFAQRQPLMALMRLDEGRGAALVKGRHEGVQRDVDDFRAWLTRTDSPVRHAASTVNDAYLRANGVTGGIASYGESLRLIVGLARSRGGSFKGLRDGLPEGK